LKCVAKIDITSIKSSLALFPLKYLGETLPDNVYVSLVVLAEKGQTGFDYNITCQSLTINNYDSFETEDFFRSINVLMETGTVEDFGVQIANTILDSLIGGESQKGFAYALKDYGAKSFSFTELNGTKCFIVAKN
jgi:hypothetical protein